MLLPKPVGDQKQDYEVPAPDLDEGSGPVALLRFDSGPSAEKLCETAQERGFVQLRVSALSGNTAYVIDLLLESGWVFLKFSKMMF